MSDRQKYKRKKKQFVTAVCLDLETQGFTYEKWGGEQRCKAGDWIVNNDGDVYTVDGEVFLQTYKEKSPGLFFKDTPIWAEVAETGGVVETKEGSTQYEAGDYIVSNNEDGSDAYAISAEKFERMYETDS
jgi:hypothetical protein